MLFTENSKKIFQILAAQYLLTSAGRFFQASTHRSSRRVLEINVRAGQGCVMSARIFAPSCVDLPLLEARFIVSILRDSTSVPDPELQSPIISSLYLAW